MKKKEDPKGPAVVTTYEDIIEYTCPVRGLVRQKVKVKRVESVEPAPMEDVLPSKSLADELDRRYSGLVIPDDSLEEDAEDQEI
jgi:hypothetical protein